MVAGAGVWLVIGVAVASFLVATLAIGRRRLPGVLDVAHVFVQCWAGRLLLLALWAEAGWHLFTQRP